MERGAGSRSREKRPRRILVGPENASRKDRRRAFIDFLVHRDRQADAAVIEVQGHRVVLKANQWSRWTRLDFELAMPLPVPAKHVSGICRFYLQEVTPNFRLYVTPVNIDPSAPAGKISEPPSFIQDVSERLGLFPTIGFQEDCNVRMNRTFADDEFVRQAEMVLEERIALGLRPRELRRRLVVLLFLQRSPAVAHALVGHGRAASHAGRCRGEAVLPPHPPALPAAGCHGRPPRSTATATGPRSSC